MSHSWITGVVLAVLVWTHASNATAQTISKEQLAFYTAEWKGERFPDGRPKVPDGILERMKAVSIEEAWGVLRGAGYNNQFDGEWRMIHSRRPIVGRALTAVYMPARPELAKRIIDKGHQEGRIGAMNSWPIDALQKGDVYVADAFGKVIDGTLIGDNLAIRSSLSPATESCSTDRCAIWRGSKNLKASTPLSAAGIPRPFAK